MKPYYQDKWVTIYHGDCREILPLVVADVVITDPPYLAGVIGTRQKGYVDGVDIIMDCKGWFDAISLVTDRIVITPGIDNVWSYPKAKWLLCWEKPGAQNPSRVCGYNVWEPILIYGKGHKYGHDYFREPAMNLWNGHHIDHPCPKPPDLFEWLILHSSRDTETVLDPFLGSGTTAVAAKHVNRKCIGIEIEEKYCEIAANRCRQDVMELVV